jgi:hypothetical protein
VNEDPGGSADEQRGEDRPADEAAALADGEREHLGDQNGGEQAHPQGSRVTDDGRELIAAGEHRQRQCHADDPEHHSAQR